MAALGGSGGIAACLGDLICDILLDLYFFLLRNA